MDNTMIHIGHKAADKESIKEVREAIKDIIKIAYDCHLDQKTIRFAIAPFAKSLEVSGDITHQTISGCNMTCNTGKKDDSLHTTEKGDE